MLAKQILCKKNNLKRALADIPFNALKENILETTLGYYLTMLPNETYAYNTNLS